MISCALILCSVGSVHLQIQGGAGGFVSTSPVTLNGVDVHGRHVFLQMEGQIPTPQHGGPAGSPIEPLVVSTHFSNTDFWDQSLTSLVIDGVSQDLTLVPVPPSPTGGAF